MKDKTQAIDIIMISDLEKHSGGRETWLYNFVEYINEYYSKYKFTMYSATNGKTNFLNSKVVNFKVKSNYLPASIKFTLDFVEKRLFIQKKSDFVIAVGGVFEAVSVLISYRRNNFHGKRVLWLRSIFIKEKSESLNFISRFLISQLESLLYSKFDLIIANGPDTARYFKSKGLAIKTICNAINLDKWPSTNKFEGGKIKICYIGRLSKVKGIEDFISSINIIDEIGELSQFEFHVIGDGTPELKNKVEKLSDKGLLTYHGAIANDKLSDYLIDMDCCVGLTYCLEDFGGAGVSNALLEQMSSGALMIVWDNEVFSQVLSKESAVFVEQGSDKLLAESYMEIKMDTNSAKLKIKNSLEIVKSYSIEAHVSEFIKEINKL